MDTLKVSKGKLLEILKGNRDSHRKTFLEAQNVYRKAVITELDSMLEAAQSGLPIRKHVNLAAPEDHTADYEEMIGLLELATDDLVDISQQEYKNYAMDKWAWNIKAKRLNDAYAAGNTSAFFVGENASFPSSSY